MALRQIHDVNVVTQSRSVRRVEMVAEDRQRLPLTRGHLRNERHQVVRNAVRLLADQAARVRAHGIEVPQPDQSPRVSVLLFRHRLHDLLDVKLRLPIRVRDADAHLAALVVRRLRCAVHRRRRRKDHPLQLVLRHQLHQIHSAVHVVLVIRQRLLHRLAHRLQTREMDHRVELPARVKHPAQRLLVANITEHQTSHIRLIRELAHTSNALRTRVREVIHDRHHVPCVQQLQHRVAADEARASRHQDLFAAVLQASRRARALRRRGLQRRGAAQCESIHSFRVLVGLRLCREFCFRTAMLSRRRSSECGNCPVFQVGE